LDKKTLFLTQYRIRKYEYEDKTWPVAKTIDADYSGYSCLTRLPNGQIGLLYERNAYNKEKQKKHPHICEI
jgi:hypothetical protein